MPSAKPGQPPAADLSVLVKRVDELSKQAGLGPIPIGATKLPLWKRWIGAEKPEYDGKGLRDVVNANALYLDQVKDDIDTHKALDTDRHQALAARVSALEAQSQPPFPGS